MKRLKVVRIQGLDEPKVDLSQLEGIAFAESEPLTANPDQWEEYLKDVNVKKGEVVLIGYNNGDVDVIVDLIGGWVRAVSELREWLDQWPDGGSYEIYWKFSGGSVRRYSKDY